MKRLAVIILTYNEEGNIRDCIESARFADEILVIDSGSTDHTCAIAEQLGARICQHSMDDGGFAGQRNFALTQTSADWVFYLDADERMTPEAGAEVRQLAECSESTAYEIKRMNIIFGQRMLHGAFPPDWSCRLYPRGEVHWDGVVHESAQLTIPVRRMRAVMHHYAYGSWQNYFQKFNRYTTLMAEKMYQKGKRTNMLTMQLHAIYAFVHVYILKRGFLDGGQGFLLSVFHYFYTLTKYVKLYYKQKENN